MAMLIPATPLDSALASFRTHLNYARRMNHLLSGVGISLNRTGNPRIYEAGVDRFQRLHNVTNRSIEMDMELARENHTFAVVAAPWFAVKCYYALYYLETILVHKMDGILVGFSKGGHKGVRRKMADHLQQGTIVFSLPQLSRVQNLAEIGAAPPIGQGQNARADFWEEDVCTDSMLKKLAEYKLHDTKNDKGWNFHRPIHRAERDEFITRERITATDFFYWYRIKANYRDLDYIDFENGLSAEDVIAYMEAYYGAYSQYRDLVSS